jgi:hypothetical protein
MTHLVHFLLRDHLDRGFNSTSTYDTLGKNVGEYLRSICAHNLQYTTNGFLELNGLISRINFWRVAGSSFITFVLVFHEVEELYWNLNELMTT